MIVRLRHGQRAMSMSERRAGEFGSSAIPRPGHYGGGPSSSGMRVTNETAFGVPAVSYCVRLICETIASFHVCVFKGLAEEKRKARDTWQSELFHERPTDQSTPTPVDFLFDGFMSLVGCGNAFIHKIPHLPGQVYLDVLDPDRMYVERDKNTGERRYYFWNGRRKVEIPAEQMLHVRGFTTKPGAACGVSLITLNRDPIGTAIAQERFIGRYYQRDARPGITLVFPGEVTQTQAQEYAEMWDEQHAGGEENWHATGVIGGGAKIETVPISLADSQFVEAQKWSVEKAALMFGIPRSFLIQTEGNPMTTEQDAIRLLNFGLWPWMARFIAALRADDDLFYGSGLYPEFDTGAFLRLDAKTRAEVDHKEIQSGLFLVDEKRASRGMEPLPPVPEDPLKEPGKVPQVTPVGGAPVQLEPPPSDGSTSP